MPVETSSPIDVADLGGIVLPGATSAAAAPLYDAFISYSHAKDKALASALQSAMQRLGKPWYRRRALRLFRDDTSLTATPHLWPSIEKALGQSRFLILMASPEAAASRWVNQELAWWLNHNGPDTVLIALTAGELDWDGEAGDFRASGATPLPPALTGKFADEPLWIDLRPYREAASPRDAPFTDLAASIAAALHGRAKEDLLSQEVRQQRHALRLAGSAVALLLVLLGLAGWQWNVARTQRDRAEYNLSVATEIANDLVFDLAQKFRDSGIPAAVVEDILTRARHLQDQLATSGQTSPALRYSQAAALSEAVDTLLATGDTQGALAAVKQARDLMQGLTAADPANTAYRRELAVIGIKVGDVLSAQGDLAGALAAYREALATRKELAATDTGNATWQHDLVDGDINVGHVLRTQGDLPGALAAYREALVISKALAEKDPGNTEWQRDLSVSNINVGAALQSQGDLAGALLAYREALAIRKELAAKEPGNTQWQRDLSVCDNYVGDVLLAQGDLAGALASYRDGHAIAKALTVTDPANAGWQGDLSFSDEKVGDALRAQGDLAGALATYRDGLAIRQALAAKDPGNTEWQRDLARSDYNIGDALRAQGDLAGALASFRDSQTMRKALTAKDPSNTRWQRDLAVTDERIGDVLMIQGDLPGALAAYRDELAIERALTAKAPGNTGWQTDLVISLYKVARAGGQPQTNLAEALTILQRLDSAGTLPPDKKKWIGILEAELAKVSQ